LHPKNIHSKPYDFTVLQKCIPELKKYVFINQYNTSTINFNNPLAVLALNKALLCYHYNIKDWDLPEGYLYPPVPGRVDYIHHLSSIITNKDAVRGLDIGVGANCIYPILGAQIYNWEMVGADINEEAIRIAKQNIKDVVVPIDIRFQSDPAYLFKGIIKEDEYFHFTMCNPPFYSSAKEAQQTNVKKKTNLKLNEITIRNFGGQANELWCNGGEALFIKRMIKESIFFKDQVGIFTTLVSRKEHLPKLLKQLIKLKAYNKIIDMNSRNKKTRILIWSFKKEI